MRKLLQFGLLVFFVLFFCENLSAQSFNRKYKYKSIGLNLNAMNYVGEVDPGPSFISPGVQFTRWNIGFCGIQRLKPRFSVRGNISYGRIKGDDSKNAGYGLKDRHRRVRNLSFRNDIFEIKADAIFDLYENRGHYSKRPDYTPYAFIGIAYFHHNPITKYNGEWVKLHPLKTENKSYSLHQIALPIGVGFRYKLSREWDLAFEIGWRFTVTDYLDDIGRSYADRKELQSRGVLELADRSAEGYDPTLPPSAVNLPRDEKLEDFIEKELYTDTPTGGFAYDPDTDTYYVRGFGQAGDKRGDKNRDWYIVTGFHLTYIIPERVICPKFR